METLKYRATGPGRRVAPAGSRAGRGAAQAKAAPCRGMVAGATWKRGCPVWSRRWDVVRQVSILLAARHPLQAAAFRHH